MILSAQAVTAEYEVALHEYLVHPAESGLRLAYELGREAVTSGLSLLDLAQLHDDALGSALRRAPIDPETVVRRSGAFFFESLSAFEMVRQGLLETREIALRHRSQLEMLRKLSGFLADTSLATSSSEPLQEVLRLIAEQALDLISAKVSLVTVSAYGWSLQASAHLNDSADADESLGPEYLSGIDISSGGRLATNLMSLDGTQLGSIVLLGVESHEDSAVDEAILLHLSQMASAAVERMHFYS